MVFIVIIAGVKKVLLYNKKYNSDNKIIVNLLLASKRLICQISVGKWFYLFRLYNNMHLFNNLADKKIQWNKIPRLFNVLSVCNVNFTRIKRQYYCKQIIKGNETIEIISEVFKNIYTPSYNHTANQLLSC